MHVFELGVEVVFRGRTLDLRRARPLVADRPIELVDALRQHAKPAELVFDPIDALEVAIDDLERLLDLVQPLGAARRPARGARQRQIGRGHDHIERRSGDNGRNRGDPGMDHQPCRDR